MGIDDEEQEVTLCSSRPCRADAVCVPVTPGVPVRHEGLLPEKQCQVLLWMAAVTCVMKGYIWPSLSYRGSRNLKLNFQTRYQSIRASYFLNLWPDVSQESLYWSMKQGNQC